MLVHSGLASAFCVEGCHTFGADGGKREVELCVPSVPIGLGILFPAPQPFQAVADMGDFIFVDFCEEVG